MKQKLELLDERIIKERTKVIEMLDLQKKINCCNTKIGYSLKLIREHEEKIKRIKRELKNLSSCVIADKEIKENELRKKREYKNKLRKKRRKSIEERIEKIKILSKKLGANGSGKNKEMIFCTQCGEVEKHKPYSYKSGPMGLGGGMDWSYRGLQCVKCNHILYESDIYKIGLKS
jgi:hypothetical protein